MTDTTQQPHAGAEREAQLIQMAKDLIVTLEAPHEPSWTPQNTVALALVTAYCTGKGDADAANAETYIAATEHIGELSLHVRQLESELAELRRNAKPVTDADHENDQLWLALANYACNCTTPEEKQVEVYVEMAGHKNYCEFRALRAAVKGDDAK